MNILDFKQHLRDIDDMLGENWYANGARQLDDFTFCYELDGSLEITVTFKEDGSVEELLDFIGQIQVYASINHWKTECYMQIDGAVSYNNTRRSH